MNAVTMRQALDRPARFLAIVAVLVCWMLIAPGDAAATALDEWPLDPSHFDAVSVWQHSTGRGITIAVLDTGVAGNAADLHGRLSPGTSFVGDKNDNGENDTSADSHGTSIAAIIAGTGAGQGGHGMRGLAPDSTILPVRVSLDSQVQSVAIAQGILYAVNHGAEIINISIGSPNPDPTLTAAVRYALEHNVIVVAAAGNQGDDGNPPDYPGAIPGVVAISGTQESGAFWPQSESGNYITVAAPAADIDSSNDHGGYLRGDGTSYAAPYVSATAALIWAEHPHATAGQVIRQIIDTAQPHDGQSRDDQFGYGTIDPLRAVTTPLPTTTTNPLLTAAASRTKHQDGTLIIAVTIVVAIAILLGGWLVWYTLRRRARRAKTPPRTKDGNTRANAASRPPKRPTNAGRTSSKRSR